MQKLKIADAAGKNEVEKPAASEKQTINAQISIAQNRNER
jgi:hypothetical protein